ncbi:MAG: PKD domain-containing protein [Sphingobacteriaceae bacterium]|nr:MAG: PKD domain-containing protein [Sphingobacteriaceae bacterium]
MKFKIFRVAAATVLALLITSVSFAQSKVLVYTKTQAFHHNSIAAGEVAIKKLGAANGFAVDVTADSSKITESNLKNYAAVVFLSTTGNILTPYQQVDLERYIQAGGGFVGVHAAADAGYDWKWYGRLVGAYFDNHPRPQQATINVVDKTHPSTTMLPEKWTRQDEWYNYKGINPNIKVLLNLDEKSYTGGRNGEKHPIAWYHDYDGGRAFYTGLGHADAAFSEDLFLQHLLGGIKYAIGNNVKLDYSKTKSQHPPEANRFTKTQLFTGGLFEPTEMTILPNLDVLIAERHGKISLYKNSTKKVSIAGTLKVYDKASVRGVNAEEGLLGIQKDPDFATNHYVYIYYSPVDVSVNRLSRFVFANDKIDMASEKVILDVASQREICCHTGGSIAFGKDHTLYLSTGDNSTPFDQPNAKGKPNINSFAPIDDREGKMQWDARRSSSNTNDLRGKILRINIQPDGSYTIPEGNLFKPGTANTRPEIYVMGNRNPYRISIDKKKDFLYWGEIGPDAAKDSMATRGPRGYDELNQARQAGYFGWPLFVGPNRAYRAYDFNTGKSGAPFDPAKPINDSKNNTGLKELPPAQPAFVWYPYEASSDFPQLGASGRSAMAGPVYYADEYKNPNMPAYYNGKMFFYEWMRGFIKPISLQPNGDFDKMEPFMEDTKFNSPIDMEFGPDGKLYVLEYGTGWFTANKDAGLARIDYNGGNRAPEITKLTASKDAGTLPFTVTISTVAKDPEKDAIASYTWNLGNGVKKVTTVPKITYTYTKKGTYNVSVVAKDKKGAASKSDKTVSVYGGNDANKIAADLAALRNAAQPGKVMVQQLDCKTCHKENEQSIGPSFTAIAKKYPHDATVTERLIRKVQGGGAGNWGDVAMPAHPDLKTEDLKKIVDWIYTLAPGAK